MDLPERASFAHAIRRIVIEQSYRAHVGHIGSALSIADLVTAVVAGPMRGEGADRDRLVLSKGHAALALYGALHLQGRLDDEQIASYCDDGTQLGVHPEPGLDGIDFGTGSLGQGLSLGAGAALAAKRQGSDRRIYVIVSDAELNEGSIWEAAMFSAHHRLDNLTLLVDLNGQQAMNYTPEVLDLGAVDEKFRVFGWDAQVAPGHDQEQLAAALERAAGATGQPSVIVATTTFGHGVSFMESVIDWHYLPLTDEQYEQAMAELEAVAA
ncbi:Apulose-4-phosphate transketolase subunit A [Baekduia alba]|uniref:transketolase n=1 Tax=Baekduia alba TaxID=2997333 RepID=UPI002340D6C4|nr:transketolase [Baekduia alba]WCB96565.1 Apulose-4-phosphate transketolase subunit A [Baekduia alba]